MKTPRELLARLDKNELIAFILKQVDDGRLDSTQIWRYCQHTGATGGQSPSKMQDAAWLDDHIEALLTNGADRLEAHLESLQQTGQPRQTLEFLWALARRFIDSWDAPTAYWYYECEEELPTEVEKYGIFIQALDKRLAEAVLATKDLTPAQRQEYTNAISSWPSPSDGEAADYLDGDEYRFSLTQEALDDYWQHEHPSPALCELYLASYRANGQYDTYLAFAHRFGLWVDYFSALLEHGNTQRIAQEYRSCLDNHADCYLLIRHLWDKTPALALEIAEFTLSLPIKTRDYVTVQCLEWLADQIPADSYGELKLAALDKAMELNPQLRWFQRREELTAAQTWPKARTRYIRLTEASYIPDSSALEIYIHAGEYDLATALIETSETQIREAGAALQALAHTRAEWVVTYGRCQAEQLIGEARVSGYPAAVEWLAAVRQAYQAQDESTVWQGYLEQLLKLHRRKVRLIPLLQGIA